MQAILIYLTQIQSHSFIEIICLIFICTVVGFITQHLCYKSYCIKLVKA